jgi:hypothetical protein
MVISYNMHTCVKRERSGTLDIITILNIEIILLVLLFQGTNLEVNLTKMLFFYS